MPLFAVKVALMKWLQYAIIIICVGGASYLGLQGLYRNTAFDPQVQIVDDVARAVGGGVNSAQIIPNPSTDVAVSLAPFLAAFAADRSLVRSSGVVDGSSISLPNAIFDSAVKNGEARGTWEPKPGVRVALVVRMLQDGTFIAAGKNLRETDARIGALTATMALGLGLALLLTLLLEMFGAWRHAHAKPHTAPATPAPVQ